MRAHVRAGCAALVAAALVAVPVLPAQAITHIHVAYVKVDGVADGSLSRGETSGLTVALYADGDENVIGAEVTLSSTGSGISVTEHGPRTYSIIPASDGTTSTENQQPFVVAVSLDAPCGPSEFNLEVSSSQGTAMVPFSVDVACPSEPSPLISWELFELKDTETGDRIDDVTFGQPTEVVVTLFNVGTADARPVTGHLSAPGNDAEIAEPEMDFGAISVDGQSTRTFTITLTECNPAGLLLWLAIEGAPAASSGGGGVTQPPEGTIERSAETRCPGMHPQWRSISYDDTTGGDGDGIPEPGETVAFRLHFENQSSETLTGLSATLLPWEHMDILQAESTFPDAEPREVVASDGEFVIRIHEDVPTITVRGSGCIYWLGGDYDTPLPHGTTLAALRNTFEIRGDQGTTTLYGGSVVAVCSAVIVDADDADDAEDLADTGRGLAVPAMAGAGFVLVGMLLRRRATRVLDR